MLFVFIISTEPLRFLEIHYKGAKDKDEKPYGLVGKGITFDSGGISLKPSANMALMKGDMGGAATVAGALYGISKMKLPVNIVTVIPLCENMPSGNAIKPGDVIKAMNGSSIEILNTDAEGRLILVKEEEKKRGGGQFLIYNLSLSLIQIRLMPFIMFHQNISPNLSSILLL
jgi:leucyl aminopeptidase